MCAIVYWDSDLYKHIDQVDVAPKYKVKKQANVAFASEVLPSKVGKGASGKNQRCTESSTSLVEAIKGRENLVELPVRQPGVT